MENLNIKIQYLYHSGFIVERGRNIFIFDYYQGSIDLQEMGDRNVLVLASHAHPDHFNPLILEWQNERPNIQYILSSDINILQKNNDIKFISAYQDIEVDDIKIRAYASTDEGVSFLVQCEGINIFHAGDLNWWYWWDDSEEEIAKAEKLFKEEIAKIKKERIDIVFFPVDPRLEHNYCLGAEYFINEVEPKFLIPMHFADDYEAPKTFAKKMKNHNTKVTEITRRGQEIIV